MPLIFQKIQVLFLNSFLHQILSLLELLDSFKNAPCVVRPGFTLLASPLLCSTEQTRQQNKKKKEGALSDRLPYHIKTRLFLSKDHLNELVEQVKNLTS